MEVSSRKVKANHCEKFYRARQVLFDQKNVSDSMDMRLNSALQTNSLDEYNRRLKARSEAGQGGLIDSELDSFLEPGTHSFPFTIELDSLNKKPPSFNLTDQPILKDGE
jgi:hypothetical protein